MASTVLARQWLFLGAALLLIGSVIGWNLYTDHNTLDTRERERLAAQARVIDQNLMKQLHTTNYALESIRSDLPFLKAQKDSKALINRRLQAMSEAMPGVRTLFIFDADATVIASNRQELIGINFRERDYFQTARQSRNPAMLHLSPPYKTVLGVFAMTLVKVIPDERGRVAGMVGVTIDPEYFKTLLDSVRYAPDTWTSIAHGDGKMFLMIPQPPGNEGTETAKPGSFYTRHRDSGQQAGVMTGISYITGEELMMALRTIKPANLLMDKDLVVAVARNLPAIFAVWRRDAFRQGGLFGMLILATTLGLYFYQKRQRGYDRLVAEQEAERKRAEETLRESEESFRTLAVNANDGILIAMGEGVQVFANQRAGEITGYSVAELVKTRIQDLVHPGEVQKVMERYRKRLAGEPTPPQYETIIVRKDGKSAFVELTAAKTVWHGSPADLVIIRDITEHKRMEKKLQETEKHYTRLAEDMPALICTFLPDSTLTYVNPAYSELFQKRSDELIGQKFLYFIEDEATRETVRRHYMALTPENSVKTYEHAVIISDGTSQHHWHRWTDRAFFKDNGEIDHFQSIGHDITVRKQTEEALRQSESALNKAQEIGKMGHFSYDPVSSLVEGSDELFRIFDVDSDQPLFKAFREAVHPEDGHLIFPFIDRAVNERMPYAVEHRVCHKNGTVIYVHAKGETIGTPQGKRMVGIVQDITERKRAEEDLRASREQMRALAGRLQAVREEERTDMAREIHDELGGALTGMKIDVSFLIKSALKIKNEAARTSLLAGMDSVTKAIDTTIQTVRRIAMELRPGLLDDLGLVAALEWQLKDFEKRTGIRCDFSPPVEELNLDTDLSTALFRIFQEALINVARHSGATEVQVRFHTDADSSTLEVEDNGKGLEKEKTLSSMSLGLLGMRERAQMFGGRITLTGTPGTGTKVTVHIPPVEKSKMDRDPEGGLG